MANQIFKDQSLLTIELDTSYADLASASSLKIHFLKPDGTKGSWDAVQVGSTSKIKYEVEDGDIDLTGDWKFQAGIVVSGREALGEIVKTKVYPHIK